MTDYTPRSRPRDEGFERGGLVRVTEFDCRRLVSRA